MRNRNTAQSPRPNASTSSVQPLNLPVTPLPRANLACAPDRPVTVRIIPAPTVSLNSPPGEQLQRRPEVLLPYRPSPPSPLNGRMLNSTPIRQPPSSPLRLFSSSSNLSSLRNHPMSSRIITSTPRDASPAISLPDSNYPTSSPMNWTRQTPPQLHVPRSFIGSLREYQRQARAQITNRPGTPRPSTWTVGPWDSDESLNAPSDRSIDVSPLALKHMSMEIDEIFQNTDFGGSASRRDPTDTWVKSGRRISGHSLMIDEDMDVQAEMAAEANGDIGAATSANRDRRNSLPTGNVYDAQGDRLAAPSEGTTGRKRELSGGSSKAGPSGSGTEEDEKRKRRKMKGKGKVRFLLLALMMYWLIRRRTLYSDRPPTEDGQEDNVDLNSYP
jgi:hypothetical protein